MPSVRFSRIWTVVLPPLAGAGAVVAVATGGHLLRASIVTIACLLLIVLMLLSAWATLPGTLVVAAIATAALDYFFTPPIRQVPATFTLDLVALTVFAATAVIVSGGAARVRHAKRELRLLRADLGRAIDTIPALVWSMLPDGTVDYLNQTWLDYTGLSSEDVRQGRWTSALHPEETDRILAERGAAIEEGRPYQVEARLRRADGSYGWVLRRSVPLRDERGQIVRWYGAGADIDELKRTEQALRVSEAYLAEAQRLSHTGSFGWDITRPELRWSTETFRIFEYDPEGEAPTVEHVLRRVHPDDLALVQAAIDRVVQNAQDWDLDHRLLMPDGRIKHVHVVARAMRHPAGSLEFVGAVMDVTATKRAQAELSRSEAHLAQAERLSHTGSWAWNVRHPEESYCSAEWYRIFGVDPELERPADAMHNRVHAADRERVEQAVRQAVAARAPFEAEFRTARPDGTVRHVQMVGGPVLNDAGEVVELAGTVMDVTQRTLAERALRLAKERALEARFTAVLQERTRLAREMHDTILQGFTGVALQLVAVARQVTGPPQTVRAFRELIDLAQRTLVEARRVVWDLRVPTGVAGDLAASLRQVADDALRGTGLELVYEVRGIRHQATADVEAAVARILQEAIANTVRHAAARTVSVRLSYRGRDLGLIVADDGRGFAVDRDFRNYGGHWGLLGMQERADQLGGSLAVRSAPGRGAAVVVRIPYGGPQEPFPSASAVPAG